MLFGRHGPTECGDRLAPTSARRVYLVRKGRYFTPSRQLWEDYEVWAVLTIGEKASFGTVG